ncbi:hypothetical protein Ga0466249_002351 [Sporomusaceae bacterium BoRhaA]|nr:hypothetical protein [Pelorhabdus rhamnosifermentans]
MRNFDDVFVWGLVLVLIGDIFILWAELVRRSEEEKRKDS